MQCYMFLFTDLISSHVMYSDDRLIKNRLKAKINCTLVCKTKQRTSLLRGCIIDDLKVDLMLS